MPQVLNPHIQITLPSKSWAQIFIFQNVYYIFLNYMVPNESTYKATLTSMGPFNSSEPIKNSELNHELPFIKIYIITNHIYIYIYIYIYNSQ